MIGVFAAGSEEHAFPNPRTGAGAERNRHPGRPENGETTSRANPTSAPDPIGETGQIGAPESTGGTSSSSVPERISDVGPTSTPEPIGETGPISVSGRMGDSELANLVISLRRRADAADAAYLDALRRFDERDVAVRTTGLGTRSWLRDRAQVSPARTGRDLGLARAMHTWPAVGDAARAGQISAAHLHAIADAALSLTDEVMAESSEAIVSAARVTDPQLLRGGLRSVTGAVDSPRANREAGRARLGRWLDIDATFEGTFSVNGILDAESGAVVAAMLEPLARRAGPEDGRAPAVRRADALVEGARRLLDAGTLPTTASHRPHLAVTVPVETLRQLRGRPAATSRPESAERPGSVDGAGSMRRVGPVDGAGSVEGPGPWDVSTARCTGHSVAAEAEPADAALPTRAALPARSGATRCVSSPAMP